MFRLCLPAIAVALALPFAAAADKPIELFNGKDLKGWKLKDEKKSKWEVLPVTGVELDSKNPSQFALTGASNTVNKDTMLVNVKGGCDAYTEATFGDVTVEVEFMIPKGSNSGVYLMCE